MLSILASERFRQEDLSWRLSSATWRVQRQTVLLETLSQKANRRGRWAVVLEYGHDTILVKEWIHELNFISKGIQIFQTPFISWWKCTTSSRLEVDSDKLCFLWALRIEPRAKQVLGKHSISSSIPSPLHELLVPAGSKRQNWQNPSMEIKSL